MAKINRKICWDDTFGFCKTKLKLHLDFKSTTISAVDLEHTLKRNKCVTLCKLKFFHMGKQKRLAATNQMDSCPCHKIAVCF